MRKYNCREIYESYYNVKIPDGYEIHHILPVFAGGTNDVENLEVLLPEEHANKHLERYKEYGDFRDLCSYYMIGYNLSTAHKISCSEGGKIGGKITKEKQTGIFRSNEERKEWCSMGGKAAQKTLKERQISAFYDPELRHEICSKGGKNGAFTQSEWQSEFGKRGGKKNKGFRWYNDGVKSYKYTAKMQEEKDFDTFIEENENLKKGRILNNRRNNESKKNR